MSSSSATTTGFTDRVLLALSLIAANGFATDAGPILRASGTLLRDDELLVAYRRAKYGAAGAPRLALAARVGDERRVRLLLDNGADPSEADARGRSAMHAAAAGGHAELCALLWAAGGDVTAADDEGREPLDVAIERGDAETCRALMQCMCGSKEGDGGERATKRRRKEGEDGDRGEEDGAAAAATAAADASSSSAADDDDEDEDEDEYSPAVILRGRLLDAIEEGMSRAALFLIDLGADIRAEDEDGRSVFALAIENNLTDVAERLISEGLDINDLDDDSIVGGVSNGSFLLLDVSPQRLIDSPDLCLDLIRNNGGNLRLLPSEVRTSAFDREAALLGMWAFGYLRPEDKTEALLIDVLGSDEVDFDPAMLGEEWAVPDELLTAAVAAAARRCCSAAQLAKWAGRRSPLFR
jgi:ankyrin repeat protein